jgi:hypothetical protein
MKHLPKQLTTALSIISTLMLIWNCEAVDSEDPISLQEPGAVRIVYNGINQNGDQSLASFSIINDSTGSLQYFAYDFQSMHYSTEMQTDTGWVYLAWNWCGTGASYFPLEPQSQVEFHTGLPANSCTWRVLLSIADMDFTTSAILRSESIQYEAP